MDLIDDFLAEHAWSDETKTKYRRAVLLLLADGVDVEHLTAPEFGVWLRWRNWCSSTQWVTYSAIKQYLNWRFGSMHPALKLKIKRVESGAQRCLELAQVMDLLASFDTSHPMGVRNLAMCCLFLDTGLRVSEICRLKVKDLDMRKRTLSVIVKGGKPGSAVFSELTAHFVEWWIDERARFVKAGVRELFVGISGLTPGQMMTRSGVQSLMRRWVRMVPSIDALSPHDFRRTFATIGTEQGAPERVLAEAGRWSSTEMIKKYTKSLRQREFLRYSPVTAALELKG